MLSWAVRTSSTIRAYWLSLGPGGGPERERAVEVEAAAEQPGACGGRDRQRLAGEARGVHLRASAEHEAIAGHQLARAHQELVTHRHLLGSDVLQLTGRQPMRQPRGRRLELVNRGGRAPLGIALQRLAAGLHEDDDETGERLAQRERRDDGQHRHEVGREPAGQHAAQGAPDDGQPGDREPRRPGQARRAGGAGQPEAPGPAEMKRSAAPGRSSARGGDQTAADPGRVLAAAEAEAHAAHRGQERLARRLRQLPAQVPHVHVHHVALRVEVHVPYLLQQRGPAHDLLRVQQEVLEELELLRGEVEALIVDAGGMAEAVEGDRPVAEHLEALGAAAPLQRPDPGEQLVEVERLREVVVGAGVEAAHHVLDGVARGEHQDRRVATFTPQLGRDLEPVLLGKHHVEQDDVVLVDVGQHGGLVAIGRDVHHVALLLQSLLDESGDLPVVLHDENLHGRQSRERC